MKDKKREPLLCDKWIASYDPLLDTTHGQFVHTTRDNIRLAKRFVLDTEATRYCAEILREAPRIVADAQDFAIAPFHRTYIEIPYRTWFHAITGRESDPDGDTRVGYLLVGNTVRVISESPTREPPMLWPGQFELWNPFTVAEEIALCQKLNTSRLTFDIFYWGESALRFMPGQQVTTHTFDVEHFDKQAKAHEVPIGERVMIDGRWGTVISDPEADDTAWDKEGLRALRANHRFELLEDGYIDPVQQWKLMYSGQCGELRNVIALLLFLNRTSKIQTQREVGMSQKFTRKGPMPLLKHRVITLHVNPKPRLLKLVAGEGIRRRLHDVRGHFCHNRVARENQHDHVWIEAEEGHLSEMQWYCECGGLRWWRHEHQRGHERKGIVTSDYKVVE